VGCAGRRRRRGGGRWDKVILGEDFP
jgi:hypothetical protein